MLQRGTDQERLRTLRELRAVAVFRGALSWILGYDLTLLWGTIPHGSADSYPITRELTRELTTN